MPLFKMFGFRLFLRGVFHFSENGIFYILSKKIFQHFKESVQLVLKQWFLIKESRGGMSSAKF